MTLTYNLVSKLLMKSLEDIRALQFHFVDLDPESIFVQLPDIDLQRLE